MLSPPAAEPATEEASLQLPELSRVVSFDTTTSGTDESSPLSGRKRQTAEMSETTKCQYFELGAQSAKKRRVGENSDLCELYESADWTIGGRRRQSDERGWVEVPNAESGIHTKENVCNQKSDTPETRGIKKGTNFLHNMTSETRAVAKGGRSSPQIKRKMSDAISTASKRLRSWMSPPKF